MNLKKDISTEENRKFWDFAHQVAEEAKRGDWQKGAVTRLTDKESPATQNEIIQAVP